MPRLIAKTVVAVLAAVVAAALALHGADLWDPGRKVLVGLIVASAVLAAGSTTAAAAAEWRGRRIGARREAVDQILTAAAWAIVDATGYDYRELGFSAYRLERAWWAPWHRRLRRFHRVRARHRPVASGVRWRPGKGVIGECVTEGKVIAQDVCADYAAIWPCTQEEWETGVVPEDVKKGLTWREFLSLRGKYDVVVATPVLSATGPVTRVVGCLALDGPEGSYDRLEADDVVALLDSAGEGLLRTSG